MNLKIIFLFVALFIFKTVTGQKELFTVNYLYKDTTSLGSEFYYDIIRPVNTSLLSFPPFYKTENISFKKEGDFFVTTCSYKTEDTSLCIISDLFGHECLIVPGDTVSICFQPIKKTNGKFMVNDGKYLSTWSNDFVYYGKNKFIYSLCDSISFYTGSIFMDFINLQTADFNLQTYFDLVTSRYKNRMRYTEEYSTKYKIPATIQKLVYGEIKSTYISNLLQPLANIVKDFSYKDYPQQYIETLRNAKFNEPDLFFKTLTYYSTALQYISVFQNKLFTPAISEETRFKNIFNSINTEVKDHRMKEFLIVGFFMNNMKKDFSSFDTLLKKFEYRFPKSRYIGFLDSLYAIQRAKPKASFEEAMKASITDTAGNIYSVRRLQKGKPLVIDCWATWCAPCVYQLPFSKEFEKTYGDRIDFIYLSFDRNKNQWLQKQPHFGVTANTFLLDKNFKSLFAYHFDITSIPRYLIFDKNGKLVTTNAPRPSRKEAYLKMIEALINSKWKKYTFTNNLILWTAVPPAFKW